MPPHNGPARALSRGSAELRFDIDLADPIRGAPALAARGGLLYFDRSFKAEDLLGALRFIGVHLDNKQYALFWAATEDPLNDRFLHQVRIVTRSMAAQYLRGDEKLDNLTDQPLTVGEYALWFIANQSQIWTHDQLAGALEGGGDAQEALAFGFLVESRWGVYRLWSRPWLVTK